MKPLIPLSILIILSGFSSGMKAYGWSFITISAPFLSSYRPITEKVLTFLIGVTGIWLFSSVIIKILEKIFEKVLHSNPLARKLFPILRRMVNVLIWGFWVFFLLSLVGINISALLTGAWVGGLVIAIASKEAASNIFGSLSLIFGKFFKISDTIRIKGFEGTVEEITLSHTRLTHQDGHTIFVPNKYLTAEPVENLWEILPNTNTPAKKGPAKKSTSPSRKGSSRKNKPTK